MSGAELVALRRLAGLQREAATRFQAPGDLAVALDRRTVQTPALDLIDLALVDAYQQPDSRLIITMPPQEGKSVRVSRRFPLWVLMRDPSTRVAIASYEHGVARRWGRYIRDDIAAHPELGLRVRDDLSAQHEWQLAGHEGGLYAAGIGGALTGRPVDLLIIDDPIKDHEQADSEVYRDRVWDWWIDVAATRLAPGAPAVVILTRWHHDDLAGRLLAAPDGHVWSTLNIAAQADHRLELGETDVLNRDPGEFMVSARGRTVEQWEAIKLRSGPRSWNALYQGSPTVDAGGLFPRDSWQRFEAPVWTNHHDGTRRCPDDWEILQSWDLAFKDLRTSDYVVGQVWARFGADVYLVDQVRGRMSFTATCEALRALSRRWPQASAKLVEDAANGPAVLSALAREVPGLIAVKPQGSKYARASAVSPFVAAGNVHVPADGLASWVGAFIEEAAAFPLGKHDDQVDAFSQGVSRLMLRPNQGHAFMTAWTQMAEGSPRG